MIDSATNLSRKRGLPPGTLMHIGKQKAQKTTLSVIEYSASKSIYHTEVMPESCQQYQSSGSVNWIMVSGLQNTEAIASLGKSFNIHPLLLEDILNTRHRPKIEVFEAHLFLSFKILSISKTDILTGQISLILGPSWVLSFQEKKSQLFDDLQERIRTNQGIIRKKGADYLMYRLIDIVVDHYFLVTEHLSRQAEKLESRVLQSPDQESLQAIQKLKRQLNQFRKITVPLREALWSINKDSPELFEENTLRYLNDVYEHILQINEAIESQRETAVSIMDLHLSGISYKMNQVMQLLTLIATIFIPLTFIAGIYGMNFANMPELSWKYGYPITWLLMIAIAAGLIYLFKRKKWF